MSDSAKHPFSGSKKSFPKGRSAAVPNGTTVHHKRVGGWAPLPKANRPATDKGQP